MHCHFYSQDWFIACFRDRHLLIMTRRIIVERIKRNHKNVYKPSWLPTKGCNYSTSYRGETGSLSQTFFMKSRIFPYRDYERPVVIAIQYISCLCVLKGILSGTPITIKFVRLHEKMGKLRKIFEFDRYLYPERKLTVNIIQNCIRGVKCGRWKDYLIRITFITFADGIKVIFSIWILLLSKTF